MDVVAVLLIHIERKHVINIKPSINLLGAGILLFSIEVAEPLDKKGDDSKPCVF